MYFFWIYILFPFFLPAQNMNASNEKAQTWLSYLQKLQAQAPEDRIYLHIDKPLYKPGETIWFQAYVREGATLGPSAQSEIVYIEFLDPKGNKITEYALIAKNGIAAGDIFLGNHLLGGIYKIRAFTAWQKKQPNPYYFEKEIQLQKAVLPRLKMKMEFLRKSYAPGQEVEALLEVATLTNAPLAEAEFTLQIILQGRVAETQKLKLNSQGKALLKYKLPHSLTSADALFNALIPYQGNTESVTRSIPINIGVIKLQFYPEGGDLITGLPTRLAFAAADEYGKPTEVAGYIQNQKGEKVANFRSVKYGLGKIDFTPMPGETYTAYVAEPSNVVSAFPLPTPLPQGFAMNIQKLGPSELKVILHSTLSETVTLALQLRGKLYLTQNWNVAKGNNEKTLRLPPEVPAGVAQLTLFDSKGIPRAERLVFVNEKKKLFIEIETDKEKYLPRELVKLTIKARDERGMPVPGQFSMAVVDDKLLSMQNDKSGNILTGLLLEPDVKDKIEEVSEFMDPIVANAPELLDLLLMTRFWRRFRWEELPDLARNAENLGGGELAIIEGKIWYQNFSQKGELQRIPAAGATLRYWAGKDSVTIVADRQGKYAINNLELYEPVTAVIAYAVEGKNIELRHTFTRYGKNQDIELNPFIQPAIALREMGVRPGVRGFDLNKMAVARKKDVVDQEMLVLALPDGAPEEGAVWEGEVLPILAAENAEEAVAFDFENQEFIEEINVDNNEEEIEKKAPRPTRAPHFENAPQGRQAPPQPEARLYYRARQFAAPIYANLAQPKFRNDFRTTLFWKSNIQLDRNGTATFSFYSSDDISAFRITVEGVGAEGSVGRGEKLYYTQLPFSMQAVIPNSVAAGDEVFIPLVLQNNTAQKLEGALQITHPKSWQYLGDPNLSKKTIEPHSALTLLLPYKAAHPLLNDTLALRFEALGLTDALKEEITTNPSGFPTAATFSGQELESQFSFSISNLVKGSLKATFSAFPTALDEILKGLESMVRLPTGCFEQASSSNYPNLLVLHYMKETGIQDPALAKKINQYLEEGYKKLIGYETQEKGFEWFGATPPHEALTAYGLMEFKDMQAVYPGVDKTLVSRTAAWLETRRDGKGGFLRDPKALDSFGAASPEITNAYITWALTEAGVKNIELEIENVYQAAYRSKDPYQLALLALSLSNVNDKRADAALKELLSFQNPDGGFMGKTHSITRSEGLSLKLETTALAALAMMASTTPHAQALQKAVSFMLKNRNQYGGYGTTQSAILVLKALSAYARFAKRTQESGTIELYLDGKKIASQKYEAGRQGEIKIEGWEKYLSEGNHRLIVKYIDTKTALPFHLLISWHTNLPASAEQSKIRLQTQFLQKSIKKGETARLKVNLTNTQNQGQPMTLARIGIPGGLQPEPWQLKELQQKKVIDFYELRPDALYIYYRQLKPQESKEIAIDLKGVAPGVYQGPASAAWLYYTPETTVWVPGLAITVEQ
jgi:hypothetical protein